MGRRCNPTVCRGRNERARVQVRGRAVGWKRHHLCAYCRFACRISSLTCVTCPTHSLSDRRGPFRLHPYRWGVLLHPKQEEGRAGTQGRRLARSGCAVLLLWWADICVDSVRDQLDVQPTAWWLFWWLWWSPWRPNSAAASATYDAKRLRPAGDGWPAGDNRPTGDGGPTSDGRPTGDGSPTSEALPRALVY